jgi:hypothetical protein
VNNRAHILDTIGPVKPTHAALEREKDNVETKPEEKTCVDVVFKHTAGDILGEGWNHTARIPSPHPLLVAKTGRNHLNEEFTPLLPTGIGERF